MAADDAGEDIVDNDGRDRRDRAQRGRQQRLCDARRHDRRVGGLRMGDADEAVHDAPHGAEQADERRDGADGSQKPLPRPMLRL